MAIDEAALKRAFADLRMRVEALERAAGLYASDADLDDPRYGNPPVKFMPRDWTGGDLTGKAMSECPPEFLDVLAERFAWSAANPKEGKEKYAEYDRKNAARARSWARRLRAGWKPPQATAEQDDFLGGDDGPL
jgi:hypothetical protein